MVIRGPLILFLNIVQLVADSVASGGVATPNYDVNRSSFPVGFIFGTASSSYQYEGAANEGGKGQSIWDTFTQRYPDKIKDHTSGVLADDSYHRYKEDVGIMKDIGFDAYRFSISWSRLLPRLKPFVTLFHWDLPQALDDAYGGFLNPQIVNAFIEYAELCCREFGDRVKHWITLNEPLTFTILGYAYGSFPPARCSNQLICAGGDSATEPYVVAHHQILAHAAAVNVYRDKYQPSQKGEIGIALNSPWILPLTQSAADNDAASRALAFTYGWFMEPLNSGSYPAEMVTHVRERLPQFSSEQSSMVKGSFDFIGINYYTANYASDVPCQTHQLSYLTDSCLSITSERNGIPIGPKAASDWLFIYAQGIQDLLLYTKNKFNNPVIYITENEVDELNSGKVSLEDDMRIGFYNSHLSFVQSAIMNEVNVRGYFAWSLLDNFEWGDGYTVCFGIILVDCEDELKRYPKNSAKWFKKFLQNEHQKEASHFFMGLLFLSIYLKLHVAID